MKRRPPSTSYLVKELRNLECSVNSAIQTKKRKTGAVDGSWFVSDLIGLVVRVVYGGCSFLVLVCLARKNGGVSSCSHPNVGYLWFLSIWVLVCCLSFLCLYFAATCILHVYFVRLFQALLVYFLCLPIFF